MFGSYANPLFKNRIGSTYFGPGFYNSTRFSGQGPSQETTPCFSITFLFKNTFCECIHISLLTEESSPKTNTDSVIGLKYLISRCCLLLCCYYHQQPKYRTGGLYLHSSRTNPLAQVKPGLLKSVLAATGSLRRVLFSGVWLDLRLVLNFAVVCFL